MVLSFQIFLKGHKIVYHIEREDGMMEIFVMAHSIEELHDEHRK
jgi:hypothetical protein